MIAARGVPAVVNKNTSESNNDPNRGRTRAAAKRAAQRQPATTASSSRVQSSGEGAASIDTAQDMRTSAKDAADRSNPRYDEIAEAAYHRYLRRGGYDGGDFDDWVEAERELRERRSR
jgi:hypothetical protein